MPQWLLRVAVVAIEKFRHADLVQPSPATHKSLTYLQDTQPFPCKSHNDFFLNILTEARILCRRNIQS